MKLSNKQKSELIDQLNYWKMIDNIEQSVDVFNSNTELNEQEEKEYKLLRKEIDEILESWNS